MKWYDWVILVFLTILPNIGGLIGALSTDIAPIYDVSEVMLEDT